MSLSRSRIVWPFQIIKLNVNDNSDALGEISIIVDEVGHSGTSAGANENQMEAEGLGGFEEDEEELEEYRFNQIRDDHLYDDDEELLAARNPVETFCSRRRKGTEGDNNSQQVNQDANNLDDAAGCLNTLMMKIKLMLMSVA